ncbi:Hypothetical predicted protein [Octopus vulgaris]|uniref:Uncharacterized protein n=1 Tax=Octopus vulgaris TaxID=6645 RepID=A0AA36BID9_OCTVU|nr:Hypothetical predicted protein [Octopus vulgaris]
MYPLPRSSPPSSMPGLLTAPLPISSSPLPASLSPSYLLSLFKYAHNLHDLLVLSIFLLLTLNLAFIHAATPVLSSTSLSSLVSITASTTSTHSIALLIIIPATFALFCNFLYNRPTGQYIADHFVEHL